MTYARVLGPDGLVPRGTLARAVSEWVEGSHGTFTAREVADELGYSVSSVGGVLNSLRLEGRVVKAGRADPRRSTVLWARRGL